MNYKLDHRQIFKSFKYKILHNDNMELVFLKRIKI